LETIGRSSNAARLERSIVALRAPFADLLDADPDDPALAALRRNELIGRPLGDCAFQDAISRRLGRAITPGKPGPKPKRSATAGDAAGEANKLSP
jgi:putative transposase